MSDEKAKSASLVKVIDAVLLELNRQGLAEAVAELGFDPTEMARASSRRRTAT